MSKRVRHILRREQRGFTLIELVAVMAILAILVAIVAPAAINSERASITAQAQADSQSVRNAATDFFTQNNKSEVRTPHTVTLTTDINDDTNVAILTSGGASAQQIVSSRWPEVYITKDSGAPTLASRTAASNPSKYHKVFPTGSARTSGGVVNVNLKDKNGGDIATSTLLAFTAIDLDELQRMNLLRQMPEGVGQTSATGVTVNGAALSVPNFLWLFKKVDSSLGGSGANDDRAVVVFTLVKVQQIEVSGSGTPIYVKLTYKQIVGP